MSAAKRRAGYVLLLAALAVMLFFFSTAYLLYMLIVLIALAAACALMIRDDAARMELNADAASGVRVGNGARFDLNISCRGRLLAAGYITVDVEISNIMFSVKRSEKFILPLRNHGEPVSTALQMDLCGETEIRCTGARVWDPLGLFSAVCKDFAPVRLMCYPKPADLDLTVSDDVVGSVNTEGLIQNKKGSDPSEMFDTREYVPGDDIRTIHWKLSSKTETFIVRESSEPSHYDVVLLPDMGLEQEDRTVSADELNSAVAVTEELAEELIAQGISFCIAVPGRRRGLQMFEVNDKREMQSLLSMWMGVSVPQYSGTGLNLFLTEHMDQFFTRLVIVSGGKYLHDVSGLGKRIGATVVSTSDEIEQPVYSALGPDCDAVVLPSHNERGEHYKVVC